MKLCMNLANKFFRFDFKMLKLNKSSRIKAAGNLAGKNFYKERTHVYLRYS